MNIEDNKKIEILLFSLKERYEAMHIIRKRVQDFCVWVMGILITISGMLFKSNYIFGIKEKIIYSFAIILIFLLVRFYHLKDLSKGFNGQQKIASKLETRLGLYDSNFADNCDTIFPKKWQNAGTRKGEGKYFKTSYYLLYFGFGIFILTIWFSGLII